MKEQILQKLIDVTKSINSKINKLEEINISVQDRNLDKLVSLILDIVGFPQDNTFEFDEIYENNKNLMPQKRKRIDFENQFSRDWLTDAIFNYFDGKSTINSDTDFIKWLYNEKKELNL